jgi:hypothetical protein
LLGPEGGGFFLILEDDVRSVVRDDDLELCLSDASKERGGGLIGAGYTIGGSHGYTIGASQRMVPAIIGRASDTLKESISGSSRRRMTAVVVFLFLTAIVGCVAGASCLGYI